MKVCFNYLLNYLSYDTFFIGYLNFNMYKLIRCAIKQSSWIKDYKNFTKTIMECF